MKLILKDKVTMDIDEIKEEVYKCSKCGLCQSVCPLYLATKNEMFLARGRYIVLNGLFNLKKQLNKKFIKELDFCLNCNACKNFCPSNIDAYKVFSEIKHRNDYKYFCLHFSAVYRLLLNLHRLFKFIYKIFPFKSLLLKSYADKLYSERVKYKKYSNSLPNKGKVVYFEGCFNKYINSSDKNASLNLIEKTGYSISKISSLCCGYPYLNEGNLNKFIKQAKKIISSVPQDAEYIICSCDSCYDTLKRFSFYIDNCQEFQNKLIRLDEFLKINNLNLEDSEQRCYFKPLLRKENCNLPNTVSTLQKKGLCSMMENLFVLKHPIFAKKVLINEFLSKDDINNKIVITSCLLTKWGLLKGFSFIKSDVDVLTYSEYANLLSDNKKEPALKS